MTKFTIITVTYNDCERCLATVHDVALQTYSEYEHIVVDGASTDQTVLQLQDNKNIKLISSPDNGIFDAMNKGIKRSNSDYIIFMNAGDFFYNKDVLKDIQKLIIDKGNPEFIYGDALEFDSRYPGWSAYKACRKPIWIEYGMVTHHQSMFFKTEFLKKQKIIYNINYKKAADYAFVSQVIKRAKNIHDCSICVSRYDLNGISQIEHSKSMLEPFLIKRRILKQSFLKIVFIISIQYVLNRLKRNFPKFYHLLRYGSFNLGKTQ